MGNDDEISLEDLIRIFLKYRLTICLFTILATFISGVSTFFLSKTYRSEAVILPLAGPSASSGVASMLAQLGGIDIPGGGAGGGSTKLMTLLQSRAIAVKVIDRFDLLKVLYKDLWDQQNNRWNVESPEKIPTPVYAANAFFKRVTFSSDKISTTITISVELEDPKLAANVANGIVEELEIFLNDNAFSQEKKHRLFIGDQLVLKRRELLETSKKLSDYYRTNQVSSSTARLDVSVALEAPIQNVPSILSPNPSDKLEDKILSLEKTKNQLDSELKNLEEVKNVPQQVYFQYLSKQLDILVSVTELLSQQYEMAKINEAKEDVSFQVIDSALEPKKKYKPKKFLIVGVTFVISFFVMVFYAFGREFFDKMNFKKEAL